MEPNDDQKFQNFVSKFKGYYLLWILINLGILLVKSNSIIGDGYNTDYFWPFSDSYGCTIESYDYREFLVYTIFPIAIMYIITLINPDK